MQAGRFQPRLNAQAPAMGLADAPRLRTLPHQPCGETVNIASYLRHLAIDSTAL